MDALSQDEIDELLAAISSSTDFSSSDDFDPISTRRIKIYDFKRPDRFSKSQIRKITAIYERVTRSITTSFSSRAMQMVHCHVVTVDQLTNAEFYRSMYTPSSFWFISDPSFKSKWVLSIDPQIYIAMLLSSIGFVTEDIKEKALSNREQLCLTENQFDTLQPYAVDVVNTINKYWNDSYPDSPINLSIAGKEVNPSFVGPEMGNFDDTCCLISIECKIGEVEGMINIAMPYESNRKLFTKIACEYMDQPDMYLSGNTKHSVDTGSIPVTIEALYQTEPMTMDILGNYLEQAKNDKSVFMPLGKAEDIGKILLSIGGDAVYHAHQTDETHIIINSPVKEA